MLLALLFLSGCADLKDPKDPLAALPDRASGIYPGQSDRAAVRAALGEPLLSSQAWQFDLFRESTSQTAVPIVFTPVPLPFGRMKDELLRYTLVAYDDAARTAALATGVVRRPSEFRRTSPIDSDYMALHLRAGDLMFFVDPEGDRRESLLALPPARDAYLKRSANGQLCTVVIGCAEGRCGDRLAVDGGRPRALPLRAAQLYWLKDDSRQSWMAGVSASGTGPLTWLEGLVPIRLAPGEHKLKFSSRHLGGEHETSLECRAGVNTYLSVSATDNGRFFNRALENWQVRQQDAMPNPFVRQPLVILHDGQWFVDPDSAPPSGVTHTR